MSEHEGSNFDDFLEEEGILEECTATGKARVAEMEREDKIRSAFHKVYGDGDGSGLFIGGIIIEDCYEDFKIGYQAALAQPLRSLSDSDTACIVDKFIPYKNRPKNLYALIDAIHDATEKLNNGGNHGN